MVTGGRHPRALSLRWVSQRRQRRAGRRSRTLAPRTLLRIVAMEEVVLGLSEERPKVRGECVDGPRPCPWVGCKHHLYLDVNPTTGAIKLNWPDVELEDMAETCSLDVADRGENTLDEVGRLMNVTRERVRQIETRQVVELRVTAKGCA